MSRSIAITKWAGALELTEVWRADSETAGWERADGYRVIETNGDPVWEHDIGFAEAWESRGRQYASAVQS